MRARRLIGLALVLGAIPVAGCGSTETYANKDRPAAPVTITGSIGASGVRLSPTSTGAGPMVVLLANLTDRPQHVRMQTAGNGAGVKSEATIPPQGTGQLQLDAATGSYQVSVRDTAITSATLKVGAKRPSAQNTLLQP